jgi:DNA-directed RNA polymerase subunit RPC12/RpoP
MSISVDCINCRRKFRVDQSWAGKRVRCKACGNVMVVPELPPVEMEFDEFDFEDVSSEQAVYQPAGAAGEIFAPAPAYAPGINYFTGPAPTYVNVPNEELIDTWAPWTGVWFLVLACAIASLRGFAAASAMVKSAGWGPPQIGYVFGVVAGGLFVTAIFVPAILSGLFVLGAFLGSRIMGFDNPRLLYWRCLSMACFYSAVSLIFRGCQFAEPAAPVVTLLAMALSLGFLWLLLRLRPIPFSVSGGMVALLGFVLPHLLLMALQSLTASLAAMAPRNNAVAVAPQMQVQQMQPMPQFPQVQTMQPINPNPFMTQMPVPHPMHGPTFVSPPTPRFPQGVVPAPATPSPDITARLKRIGDAEQAYGQANAGQHPATLQQLVAGGFLDASDTRPGPGQALVGTGQMPTMNAIPSDVIVIYMIDLQTQTYTALFGDWHVQSYSQTDWRAVRKQSALSKQNAGHP